MRRLMTILIWITQALIGADKAVPVHAKKIQPAKAEAAEQAKPDAVLSITAPQISALEPNALETVRLSEQWRAETVTVSAGPGGTIRYPYGRGYPLLVCAPKHVCSVELQPGEKLQGDLQIGDARIWRVSPNLFGDDAPIIMFRPEEAGYETNIVIATDRRAYYVRLLSRATEWVTGISFTYPEQEQQKWEKLRAAKKQEEAQKAVVRDAAAVAESLHFGYTMKGDPKLAWYPERVYDDGERTYLQMKPELASREAPALSVIGEDGKGTMTNYRVKNNTYIVDTVFDKAVLKIGVKKSKPVEIKREG